MCLSLDLLKGCEQNVPLSPRRIKSQILIDAVSGGCVIMSPYYRQEKSEHEHHVPSRRSLIPPIVHGDRRVNVTV